MIAIRGPPVKLDTMDSDMREQYLATQIEDRLHAIKAKGWTNLAEVYQKIVEAVTFAKDFITQAASNEPHAALAWAGVSIFLLLRQ
jgi:hypothetical protein